MENHIYRRVCHLNIDHNGIDNHFERCSSQVYGGDDAHGGWCVRKFIVGKTQQRNRAHYIYNSHYVNAVQLMKRFLGTTYIFLRETDIPWKSLYCEFFLFRSSFFFCCVYICFFWNNSTVVTVFCNVRDILVRQHGIVQMQCMRSYNPTRPHICALGVCT